MKALITGASSGLGKDFAIKLSEMGYDLVIVSRSKDKLEELKKVLKTNCDIEVMDLSIRDNNIKLYNKYKNKIDLLINNAGYGLFGESNSLELNDELNMIDLNIISLHTLTRFFLNDFIKKDSGTILNVASIASFTSGPLMATYYASKCYVYNYTMALYEELRHKKSNVHVHVLCPGPTDTNFNNRAGVSFKVSSQTSDYVTSYCLNKMKKNKLLILPGFIPKATVIACRFAPRKLALKVVYNLQHKKIYGDKK